MQKKQFVDYKEFLQFAFKNKDKISSFKYYGGRLYSFRTNAYNCKYIIDNGVITPNKFVSLLGFENYNAFINKKFSKLKEFAQTKADAKKWYCGFFGGLVGVNRHIVNNYVGNGEVNDFYDYDINKAYLFQLTQFLPTRFVKTLTPLQFEKLEELDKIPYIYFFELELKTTQSQYLKAIGKIKEIYKSFDFLNSKQGTKIIVSELRLNLINQIYFKDYTIKKVFVFERGRFKFYENILNRYLEVKENYGAEFKQNALRLYGTLGQINKSTPTKIRFDTNGDLIVNYKQEINFNCAPQVAMWVADSVANRLFNIIQANYNYIISWNTDGLTSTKSLGLQISKKAGKWKCKKITAIPFLFNDTGARLFFKDIQTNEIIGANNIYEENGKLFEFVQFSYSNVNKGYVEKTRLFKIDKTITFNEMKTFRNQILKEKFIKEISREYEQF